MKQIQQENLKARKAPLNKFRVVFRDKESNLFILDDYTTFVDAKRSVDNMASTVLTATIHNSDGKVLYLRNDFI